MFSFDVLYEAEGSSIKFEHIGEYETREEAALAATRFDAFMFAQTGEEGRFKIVELKKQSSLREAA